MIDSTGTTDDSLDTKRRILGAALECFAEQGFEGASIRDISQRAVVNVAAVNYHFGSKENLYFEVVRHSYSEMEALIRSAAESDPEIDDLVASIFELFHTRGPMLVNTFRMLLAGQDVFRRLCEAGCEGPPGGAMLVAAIKRRVPGVADADLFWAVRTLYSQIIHQTLILQTAPKNVAMRLKPTADDVRTGLRRTARIVMAELTGGKQKNARS